MLAADAPQAFRHHGAAVRQRPVPHRPHHGVHPGRHLGALPAPAGPQGALRLRRRHARRADHAQGRGRGHHARGADRARRPRPHARPGSASTSASTTRTPRTRRRTSSSSQSIYRKLRKHGPCSSTRKTIEQFFDPVKGMFLPDRYIKGECPKCGTKDQYGDSCENCGAVYAPTDLTNPYSALTGAKPVLKTVRALLLPALRPALRRVPARLDAGDGRLQPEVSNKVQEWLGRRGRQGARRLGHLARRALLRHRDPRRARASISTSGSMRRSATSPR